MKDYSEEVLSPTGHNGNGTVGPFFSSSGGGGDILGPEAPLDAMSANVIRLEELGHGATGCVYKAVHATTLQLLAVKEVPVHEKSRRDQIGAELRLLKHCQIDAAARDEKDADEAEPDAGSPSSLVAFYDAFTLTRSGYVSIVMEYCSGGSLQDLITRQGALKEASIASIALDMAQGLRYMHSLNMLHRDIKPANILLDREGRVKLADFGLVKILEDNESSTNNANTGIPTSDGSGDKKPGRGRAHSFVGTAVYMSPERLQGEPYGPAADVWSLGLSLLTLAIGQYPLEVIGGGSRGSGEFPDPMPIPGGGGVRSGAPSSGSRYSGGGAFSYSSAFRSVPRFSRKEPMSVFLPPERAAELRLSKAFISFLRGCLRYEPDERMTAQDMLKHPFLQVPPSERGISLAQAGGGAVAIRDNRRTESAQPNGVNERTPPKRDEYAERVLTLTGILSSVAKFHINNARGRRRSRRGSHYFSGLGAGSEDKLVPPPLSGGCGNGLGLASVGNMTSSTGNLTASSTGGNGVVGGSSAGGAGPPPNSFMTSSYNSSHPQLSSPPSSFMTSAYGAGGQLGSPPNTFMPAANGYMASPPNSFLTSNSNMASPPGSLTATLRERFAWGGRGDSTNSFNGESGAGAPLVSVVEEPPLEDDAFQRLAEHIGVHPVVVEAVWRDEWMRQAEAERTAQARELIQRDLSERQASFSSSLSFARREAQPIPPPVGLAPMLTPVAAAAAVMAGAGGGGRDAGTEDDRDIPAVAAAAEFNETRDVTMGVARRDGAGAGAATAAVGVSNSKDAREGVGGGGDGRDPSETAEREERDSSTEDDLAMHALADLPKMTMPLNSPTRIRRKM
ncbi:unnamed protein product [Scytosiphon promiscuus]